MAKKPGTNPKGEFAFFDVFYEDGSQRSNRRVPSELLGGLDGDEPARAFIMEQDREIAEKSGRPPLEIKEPRPGWDEEEVDAAREVTAHRKTAGFRPAVFVWMDSWINYPKSSTASATLTVASASQRLRLRSGDTVAGHETAGHPASRMVVFHAMPSALEHALLARR